MEIESILYKSNYLYDNFSNKHSSIIFSYFYEFYMNS